jgi:hypothetical protein
MADDGVSKVSDAVYDRDREEDHHAEPHAYVEVQVADGFLKLTDGRNGEEKAADHGVGEQHDTK